MSKPHLIQYLCGPRRHTLIGFLYLPEQLTPEIAMERVEQEMEASVINGVGEIKQECPLCGSGKKNWFLEVEVMEEDTLADGEIRVAKLIAKQKAKRRKQ